ncbi:MAG: hypothetical protein ACFFCW_01805 [Candidatus Hodarchaeota archaeon]
MAATTRTTLDSAIQELYIRRLLPIMQPLDFWGRFASKLKPEKGDGDTVVFNRVLRQPRVTSFNLLDSSTTGTARAFTSNKIVKALGVAGDAYQFERVADFTSIISNDVFMQEIGSQIIRSKNYLASEEYCTHGLPHRVDNDATYEVNGTVDSGSTTTFVDDALTQNDDHWGTDSSNPGFVCFVNPEGPLYDVGVPVTGFTAATDTCTIETVQHTPTTSTKYHVVRGTALAATDKLTVTAITRVAAIHRKMRTELFQGGILYGLIDSEQEHDLYGDSVLQTIIQYIEPKRLGNYKVLPLLDTHLVVNDDAMYRMDVDGSANASGVVHATPIFGANAVNITGWDGGDDWGLVMTHINDADTGNWWNLIRMVNWHIKAGVVVLRGTSVCNLLTGATVLPVVF